MSGIDIVLVFGLLSLAFLCGIGVGQRIEIDRYRERRKIDDTLREYDKYCQWRDAKCPEMIGKWGKP